MAWTLVQKSPEVSASAASITPTLPVGSTAGNLLVCKLIQGGNVAWTLPAGWVQAVTQQNGGITHAEIWYLPPASNPGGITGVLCSTTGTPNIKGYLEEFHTSVASPTVTLNATGGGIGGTVTGITVTTTTAAVNGDLSVVLFHEHFTVASAITWTDPANYTLGQADTASAGNHLYGAFDLFVAAGAQSVAGLASVASDSTHGWSGVVATFTAVSSSAPGTPGLVGTFLNQNIFGAGTTVQQAIADWVSLTSRAMTVRRVYFAHTWPSAVTNDLIADAAAGRKVAISFRPAHNPPTNTDAANLDQFLASCKTAGCIMDVALYSEAFTASRPGQIDAGMTAAQTIAATQFYAATVRQYYPLVFNTGSFGVTQGENNWYAGDAFIDKITTDFYCSSWVGGDRLDGAASLANAASPKKPFGVWEFNSSRAINPATNAPYQSQAQSTGYFAYLQSYFAGRLAAGLTNADLILFNSDGGSQALNSSITDPADYRIPLWQSLFDALNGGAGVNQLSLSSEIDLGIDVATTLTTTLPGFPASPGTAQGPTFPQLFLELGMPAAGPLAPPSAFILDDPVFGRLDTSRLGNSTSWVDITSFVRSGTVTRPVTRVQGPLLTYQAATLSVVLKNGDGRFDPDNLSGAYVTSGVSQIRPMVPVRLRAVWNGIQYYLYSGFADSWQDDGANYAGHYAETTLTATDGFKVLNGITIPALADASGNPAPVGAGEKTGARVVRILNAAGWYTDHRKVAAGNSALQGTALGDTAGKLLQITADSEIGELYIDGAGYLVFRNRQAILLDTRSRTPQGVFGDQAGTVDPAGTETPYVTVGRADDDTTLANDIQITNANIGTLQEARNTGSIARYLFPRTYARSDILLQTDNDALNYAGWVLGVATDAEDRFDTLTLMPARDATDLFPQALGREIGDRIQVWRRPPGAGTVTKDCFVRGITHTFNAGLKSWQTVWDLQDAAKYASFFILDDPVNGRLDHSKLAF